MPLRGRFASFDTAATAGGMAAVEENGGGAGDGCLMRFWARSRAISKLLTPVKTGKSGWRNAQKGFAFPPPA
jgi:hypothetical protein